MLTVPSHQPGRGPIHLHYCVSNADQKETGILHRRFAVINLLECGRTCVQKNKKTNRHLFFFILPVPRFTQHDKWFPRVFLSGVLYSRSGFLWWHSLLPVRSSRPTCCISISLRVHFFCMGPALLRLSSGSYCCLTVHLWYLLLSFSPSHFPRPKYDLPGGLVRQHGRVHPAVGELHLRLLYDVLHGDSLQRPWVLRGLITSTCTCLLVHWKREHCADVWISKLMYQSRGGPKGICMPACICCIMSCGAPGGSLRKWLRRRLWGDFDFSLLRLDIFWTCSQRYRHRRLPLRHDQTNDQVALWEKCRLLCFCSLAHY